MNARYKSEAKPISVALSTTAQIFPPTGALKSVDVQNAEATLGMKLHWCRNPWCLIFDGTNDVVDCDAAATDVAALATGAVHAGIRADSTGSGARVIFSLSDANTATAFWFYLTAAHELAATLVVGGTVQWTIVTDQAIPLDEFLKVKVVHDGVKAKLFINSATPAQTADVSADLTKWFADLTGIDTANVGALDYNSAGNANWFKGEVDFVVARPLRDIEAPTMHLALDEGASTTAADSSANENDATVSDAAMWSLRQTGMDLAAGAGRVFHVDDDEDYKDGLWIENPDGSNPVTGQFKISLKR